MNMTIINPNSPSRLRSRAYVAARRGEHDKAARLAAEASEAYRIAGNEAESKAMRSYAMCRARDAGPTIGIPNPNCYGCLGTGRIQGFGHHGEHCICLELEDD